jgi:hypothetical protein
MRRAAGDALSQQRQGREPTGNSDAPERWKKSTGFSDRRLGRASPERVTSTANRSTRRCMRSMHPPQERQSDHGDFSAALLDECCTCPPITCLYSIIK